MNKQIIDNIYCRNIGSEKFYKRHYCNNLVYTEGIMDFQQTLRAFWTVDIIISHLPKIIQEYQSSGDGFFVATISVTTNNSAKLEIFREGYVDKKYNEHITVITQDIPFTDLPVYDYKFYLILSSYAPVIFTFMLPNEY